ncbi:hypothetical protein [Steroidobacter cummioxidans]|uniref:hypothetical protein n=1 Tax=Steroidobacter cummioxidans TaxID=1803913 RepID=UPI00128FD595|nr:hypothetical protein [Steroidobacter cummioxidans]
MKTIRSESPRRVVRRAALSATVALAGLFGVVGTGAADAKEDGPASAKCRQETKRVAVWPQSAPKAPQMARYEERLVTVCESKADAKRAADEELQAKESEG